MSLKHALLAASAVFTLATPTLAAPEISVEDPYARAMGRMAIAGAGYFTIHNTGDEDDRLVAVRSEVSKLTELHTHVAEADGVMRMVEVEEGFAVPAGGMHALDRGGDHVMFMGLTAPLVHGESFPLTLVFEKTGEITVDVVVDLERTPGAGMRHGQGHGGHGGHGGKGMGQGGKGMATPSN